MSTIDRPALIELGYERPGPCLSLFMPAVSAGPAVRQDQVQLRKLLKRGHDLLVARGVRKTAAERLTRPAVELVAEAGLWKSGGGLALFLAPGTFKGYRVPLELEEAVAAGPRFVVRPLLPLLQYEAPFFVLHLSRGSARLLKVSGAQMEEIAVKGMPTSVEDISQFEDPQRYVSSHTAGRSPAAKGGQVFHGHGSAADTKDEMTSVFLREVDATLNRHLRQGAAPVVLAAPPEVDSDYRRVTACKNLLREGVAGNWSRSSLKNAVPAARDLIRRAAQRERDAAMKRFVKLTGTPRAVSRLDEVLSAARARRISVLFVASDAQVWGTFDEASGKVYQQTAESFDTDDLLDLAASLTLREGGLVYPVQMALVPGEMASPVAAVLKDL
jgi:hypothetical protein